jgi:hypothetical protein
MENRSKVLEKIEELNRESAGLSTSPVGGGLPGLISVFPHTVPQVWQEFPGYHALTKFDYNNKAPIFTPSSGVPVKVFLNSNTGEIRIFLASIFEM